MHDNKFQLFLVQLKVWPSPEVQEQDKPPANFKALAVDSLPEHAILQASPYVNKFDQEEGRIICVLLAALAMSSVFDTKNWDINLLNNVLMQGDKFYQKQNCSCGVKFNRPNLYAPQSIEIGSNVLDVQFEPTQECVFLTYKNMRGDLGDTDGSLKKVLYDYFGEHRDGKG